MTINLKDASDFSATNVNQNLRNIVANMDRYAGGNDFNIANHANAFNGKATGVEVWYYAGDAKAKPVAEKMSKAIADALGIVNRGAKATTSLYVIAQSKGHTLLPEWFFIDNASDVAKWQANKNKAIAAVIKVLESYPSNNFRTTHGGHYGKNMMDPGACGNGLKEAVVMQEVNKALLNYKAGGGTTNVAKVKDNYYADASHLIALQDLKTYDKTFKKVDNTWFIKKGTKFGVDRKRIVVTASGTTHAPIYGLNNTYVTLAKSHVKKQ